MNMGYLTDTVAKELKFEKATFLIEKKQRIPRMPEYCCANQDFCNLNLKYI